MFVYLCVKERLLVFGPRIEFSKIMKQSLKKKETECPTENYANGRKGEREKQSSINLILLIYLIIRFV